MAVIASATSKTYTPAPAGMHSAVCVDVVDKGAVETPWGPKHKIVIIWEIDEYSDDFDGRYVVNKQYTLSLHEKANLTQDLESWRSRAFSEEERQGFDVEKLIGVPCMLNVVHNEHQGNTYANVKAVTPLPKGMDRLASSMDYTRVKDREEGWDVRSPHSTAKQAGGTDAGGDGYDDKHTLDDHRPPVGDNFAANADEDQLPF